MKPCTAMNMETGRMPDLRVKEGARAPRVLP
jgi:hypothetical protein